MQPLSPNEFSELAFETQYLLTKNGYHEIIDGPDSAKAEYKNFVAEIELGKRREPSIDGTMEKAQHLASRAASAYNDDSFRTHVYLSQLASLARIGKRLDMETLVYLVHGVDITRLKKMAEEAFMRATDFWCGYFGCNEEKLPYEMKKFIDSTPSLNTEDAKEYLLKAQEAIKGRLSREFTAEEIGKTEFYYSEGHEGGYNEPAAIGHSRVTIRIKNSIDRHPNNLWLILAHELLHTPGYGMQMRTGEEVPENGIILLNTVHVTPQEGIADSWRVFYQSKEELLEELNPLLPEYAKLEPQHLSWFERDIGRETAYLFLKWHEIFVKNVRPEKLIPEIQLRLGIPEDGARRYADFMQKWAVYYPTYVAAGGTVLPQLRKAMERGEYYNTVKRFATEPPMDLLLSSV